MEKNTAVKHSDKTQWQKEIRNNLLEKRSILCTWKNVIGWYTSLFLTQPIAICNFFLLPSLSCKQVNNHLKNSTLTIKFCAKISFLPKIIYTNPKNSQLNLSSKSSSMDVLDSVFDPLRDFSKDSVRLVKRCHKPDRKGTF